MWFTDDAATKVIGRITPTGTITEFSTGLNGGSLPGTIAPGPDGNMWFTDDGTVKAIGQIGAGVPAASVVAPSVTGSGQDGTQQVCQGDRWADWAGQQPLPSAISTLPAIYIKCDSDQRSLSHVVRIVTDAGMMQACAQPSICRPPFTAGRGI